MESHPIIDTARDLQALISEHLEAGERRARLAPEVVSAAGEAGLFRLFAPREAGGLEVSLPVALTVVEIVGAADPAVGWYMINSMRPSLATAMCRRRSAPSCLRNPIGILAIHHCRVARPRR